MSEPIASCDGDEIKELANNELYAASSDTVHEFDDSLKSWLAAMSSKKVTTKEETSIGSYDFGEETVFAVTNPISSTFSSCAVVTMRGKIVDNIPQEGHTMTIADTTETTDKPLEAKGFTGTYHFSGSIESDAFVVPRNVTADGVTTYEQVTDDGVNNIRSNVLECYHRVVSVYDIENVTKGTVSAQVTSSSKGVGSEYVACEVKDIEKERITVPHRIQKMVASADESKTHHVKFVEA